MSRQPDPRGVFARPSVRLLAHLAAPRSAAPPVPVAIVRVAIVTVLAALTLMGLGPAAYAATPRNPPEGQAGRTQPDDSPRSTGSGQPHDRPQDQHDDQQSRPHGQQQEDQQQEDQQQEDQQQDGTRHSTWPQSDREQATREDENRQQGNRQHQNRNQNQQFENHQRENQRQENQRQPEPSNDPSARGVPKLDWTDCGDELPGLQCTTAEVPLDHGDPHGRTIELALARLPAGDPQRRIGSLFVNPGGPGGSGRQFVRPVAQTYPPEVAARFDIVGVDPRGTGGSAQVRCFDSAAEESAFEADYPVLPSTPQEERTAAIRSTQLSVNCWARSFWLLPHLSTANVARDFDLVRQAMGDDRISFAGISYGTFLGATYAAMFPDRVRALVLDGVVDPLRYAEGGSTPFLRIDSNEGADTTFAEFRRLCVAAGPVACPFAGGGDPAEKFATLAAKLKAAPIQAATPDGPVSFGYPELIYGTLGALYVPSLWGPWSDALEALHSSRDAEAALDLTRRAAAAGVRGLAPVDESQVASLCADADVARNPYAFGGIAAAADAQTPYFGRLFTYVSSQSCATWLSAGGSDRYVGPWAAETASPALVIGTRFDPATPYENAQTLAGLLGNGALLTLEGWGHTSFGLSGCVNRTIEAYLIDEQRPAPGASCSPDAQPFATSPAAAPPAGRDVTPLPGVPGRRPPE